MPTIGTFSAWIKMDGGKMQEFSVEYSPQEKRSTCWIASQEGKVFEIGFKNSMSQFATSISAHIDGTKASHATFPASMRREAGKFRGLRMSDDTRKQFQFAKYRLLEEDDNVNVNASQHVGEIMVHVKKVKLGLPVPRGLHKHKSLPPLEVSEKAKKGLVHGVELGQTIAARAPKKYRCRVTSIEHVATFVFKYRPLDVLRADGVVPLDTSASRPFAGGPQRPTTVPAQGDIIDLTLDDDEVEINEGGVTDLTVETRVQALEAELALLKNLIDKKRKRTSSNEEAGTRSVKKEFKAE